MKQLISYYTIYLFLLFPAEVITTLCHFSILLLNRFLCRLHILSPFSVITKLQRLIIP